jgi:hypothetical protein
MDDIRCANCGASWRAGQTRCQCGSTGPRLLFASSLLKGEANFRAFPNVAKTIWEKNWGLITIYLIVQVVFIAVSYWTE